MKVDLSEHPFNSVGITFNNENHKLFHGDTNDNAELQRAFPEYFERPAVESTLHIPVEPIPEPILELNPIKPYDYPNLEDCVKEAQLTDEELEILEEIQEIKPIETPRQESTVSILNQEEIDALLDEAQDMVEPKEDIQEKFKKAVTVISTATNGILDFVMSLRFIVMTAMLMIAYSAISFDIDGWKETYHRLDEHSVALIIFSLYVAKMAIIKILSVGVDTEKLIGTAKENIGFYFNHYVLRAVLMTSLLGMIFVSSVGIYSSLAVNTVGDAKTVDLSASRITFVDDQIKTANGRIVTVRNQIPQLEKNTIVQLKALDDSILSIKEKIANTDTRISELPKNYKTAKRNLQIQKNRMNDEVSAVQEKKTNLITLKADKIALINQKIEKMNDDISTLYLKKQKITQEVNDLQMEGSNKALNFTAELLGVSLLELLKFINLLMTFVLELTYLALTFVVVRMKYYIK